MFVTVIFHIRKKKKTLNDLLKVMCAVLSPSVVSVAWRAPLSMGILQASILEWVAMLSSRESSRELNQGLLHCWQIL